jgi:DNA primase
MIPSHLDFKHLKRVVSIADVLRDKGLIGQYRTRGDKLTGPCPVHGGDNPNAFVADLSRNVWHCFTGCNTGGDVVEFVRAMERKTYRQVAQYLSTLAALPPTHPTGRPSDISPSALKPFRPFTRALPLNPYAPLIKQKKIQPSTARWFEAGSWHGQGFLQDCIGVRLHDPRGNPIGYAGRRVNPSDMKAFGKWKFPTALPKSSLLYNYHRVLSSIHRGLVVVECPWGVMRLHQLAVPAVALLGTALCASQIDLLRKVPHIVLMLDGDPAGETAMRHISAVLDPITRVQSFHLPDGLDPDDLDDLELNKVSHLLLS